MSTKIRFLAGGLIIVALLLFGTSALCDCGPVWGDVNDDGAINPQDVTYMVQFVYFQNDMRVQPPDCPLEAGDVTGDGNVNPQDVTYYVQYVYMTNDMFCDDPCGPNGYLVSSFGCKTFGTRTPMYDAPSDQDCIEYQYDGESVLLLRHVNAGFNCCPDSLTARIRIREGMITIDEAELLYSGGCYCLCLFDVDYEIVDLPPGEYTIRINGMYLLEGDEVLEFTVDLASSPSGSFCVPRDHYPWGAL